MQIMAFFIWTVLFPASAGAASTEELVTTASCQVTGFYHTSDQKAFSRRLPATLVVYDSEGTRTAEIEVEPERGLRIIRVSRDDLPDRFPPGVDVRKMYLFDTGGHVSGERLLLLLKEPSPGNSTKKVPVSEVRIMDAFGRPGAGFRVSLGLAYGGVIDYYTVTLDEQARFPIVYPQTSASGQAWQQRSDIQKRREESKLSSQMEKLLQRMLDNPPSTATLRTRHRARVHTGGADDAGSSEAINRGYQQELSRLRKTIAEARQSEEDLERQISEQRPSFARSAETRLVDAANLAMRIEHPTNGMSQSIPYPPTRLHRTIGTVLSEVETALVGPNADRSQVFTGKIQDENGNPMSSIIRVAELRLPGRGDRFPQHGPLLAVPSTGEFEFALPRDFLVEHTGSPTLTAPAGVAVDFRSPVNQKEELKPGIPVTVTYSPVVRHAEMLTFVFHHADGTTSSKFYTKGYTTGLEMRRLDESDTRGRRLSHEEKRLHFQIASAGDGTVTVGPVPLPGRYEVEFEEKRYRAQQLEPGAGSKAVTWMLVDDRITYQGQVVDFVTSNPIAGAYLMLARDNDAPWRMTSLDQAKRDVYWKDVPSGGSVVREVTDLASVGSTAVGRTDHLGQFAIAHPQGAEGQNIVVWAPGYVGMTADSWTIGGGKPLLSGNVILPTAALPPAAEVTAMVLPPPVFPDEHLRTEGSRPPQSLGFNVSVSFAPNPEWKGTPPFANPTKEHPWKAVWSKSWNDVGDKFAVVVPAGVTYSVWTSNANQTTVECPAWKDQPPLAQGARIDLPPKEPTLKRPFIIRIVKADGSPASGMAVRLNGALPLITDSKGEVTAWTHGYVGRIEVYPDRSWKVLATKKAVEVDLSKPAPVVEIRLP